MKMGARSGRRCIESKTCWGGWPENGMARCFLKEKFWRIATKKHRKPPATMAIAHTLLVLCYQVLKSGQPHPERGLPVMDEKQRNRLICHHMRRLGKLGIRVRSLAVAEDSRKSKRKTTAADRNRLTDRGKKTRGNRN